MRKDRILVCDIDNTLVRDGRSTAGLNALGVILSRSRKAVRLVYATGRTFSSTWSLVEAGTLPRPDAVAAMVGTEIWLPNWRTADAGYARRISAGWNVQAVRDNLSRFDRLEPQPDRLQTEWKASYFLDPRHSRLVEVIRVALSERGVKARVLYSAGRYLDVIPFRAGKGRAVKYLSRLWADSCASVLACGDSGNDLDMLAEPGFLGVIVGNSSDRVLRRVSGLRNVYRAELPFAAGVVEGAAVHGFWPGA